MLMLPPPVRRWWRIAATLLVDARPDAMDSLWFILARSLTCEILADDPAGYTVGMLSALAGQLGVPPEVILAGIPDHARRVGLVGAAWAVWLLRGG